MNRMKMTLAAALVATVGLWSPAATAQKVGDVVGIRAVCVDRAMVERHVQWSFEDRNYNRANKEFLAAIETGECIGLPNPGQAPIQEVGLQSEPFIDLDGDRVQLSAIRVYGVWTMYIEVLPPELKT